MSNVITMCVVRTEVLRAYAVVSRHRANIAARDGGKCDSSRDERAPDNETPSVRVRRREGVVVSAAWA